MHREVLKLLHNNLSQIYNKGIIINIIEEKFENINCKLEVCTYQGRATETEQNIYISMNNDDSKERVFITFFKGAGTFNRYIGIMNAQSSSCLPVSFKCVCVPPECINKINIELLNIILSHKNQEWNDTEALILNDKIKSIINARFAWAFFKENRFCYGE